MISHPFSVSGLPPLSLSRLAWFEGAEAANGAGLGRNRDYRDLRGVPLEAVRRVVAIEREQVESVLADGPGCDGCDDGCGGCDSEIDGLELGVVSAVAALSSIGCIPYTNCNGGVFGREHMADFLIVGFYLRRAHVETVREAARGAGVGLTNDREGGIMFLAAIAL